jgi:type IV secretory pathway VirD2 relaxase
MCIFSFEVAEILGFWLNQIGREKPADLFVLAQESVFKRRGANKALEEAELAPLKVKGVIADKEITV